ncbi:MAG: DUF4292 domain-containing protein [Desulfuromonadaceae bacterium]
MLPRSDTPWWPSLFRGVLVLLLCALFGSACAPLRPEREPERVPLSSAQLDALLLRLEQSGQPFHSLQGMARIQLLWHGEEKNLKQVFHLEWPDRFRAETLNPFGFGSPALLMAADGRDLTVVLPGEGLVLRGAASAQNVQRVTQLPLQIDDLVNILLWRIQAIAAGGRSGSLGPTGDYRLELYAVDGRWQQLSFDRDMRLLEASWYQDGRLLLQVRYDQFSAEAVPFPQRIQINLPPQRSELSLTFSDLELNRPLAAKLFQLATPPGYQERPFP